MRRHSRFKVGVAIALFAAVAYGMAHWPLYGVHFQSQATVRTFLGVSLLLGIAFFFGHSLTSHRPSTMRERKRARAAIHAEWVAKHPRPPSMAPLTPEELRPTPDFDTEPPDWELQPRALGPLPSTSRKAKFAAWFRRPEDDRDAYEREVKRWD